MLVSTLTHTRDDRVGKHIKCYSSFLVRFWHSPPEDLSAALQQLRLAQDRVDRVLHRLQSSSAIPVAVPVRVFFGLRLAAPDLPSS